MSGTTEISDDRPLLFVRFPHRAAAEARVAGMAAVARWAARAHAAGFARVAMVLANPDRAAWNTATVDDVARAGIVEPAEAHATDTVDAVVADGRYLLDEEALRSLARGIAGSATWNGMTVASRQGGAGGRVLALEPPRVADFARPASAARRILQATAKPGDGVISRWLNRPVSQRISALLLRHLPGVRPWHMTFVVAAVAVAMVLSLLFGGASGLVAGGVLFHVASVLDGVDGEIARAGYRSSQAGAVLDTRVDMITNIGYFVSIAVALTRLYGGRQAVVGGLAVLLTLTGLLLLAWLVRRGGSVGSFDVLKPYYRQRFPGGWQWLVTETLVATTSRDFFAFAFGVVIVAGAGWAVTWLLLGFAATWLVCVLCAAPGVLRGGAPAALTGI